MNRLLVVMAVLAAMVCGDRALADGRAQRALQLRRQNLVRHRPIRIQPSRVAPIYRAPVRQFVATDCYDGEIQTVVDQGYGYSDVQTVAVGGYGVRRGLAFRNRLPFVRRTVRGVGRALAVRALFGPRFLGVPLRYR